MASDVVRNEAKAVRTLRSAIARYAREISSVTDSAIQAMARVHRDAEEVERRRSAELRRAEGELGDAQQALARCAENCGSAQQRVAVATRWHAEAKQARDRARRAVSIVADAERDLARSLRASEGSVAGDASAAVAALGTLEARLHGLGSGTALHRAATAMVVTAEVAGAVTGLGRVTADALQAGGLDSGVADHSVTQMVERDRDQGVDYVIEHSCSDDRRP